MNYVAWNAYGDLVTNYSTLYKTPYNPNLMFKTTPVTFSTVNDKINAIPNSKVNYVDFSQQPQLKADIQARYNQILNEHVTVEPVNYVDYKYAKYNSTD